MIKKPYKNLPYIILFIIPLIMVVILDNTNISFAADKYKADDLIKKYCVEKDQDENHPKFFDNGGKMCQCGNDGKYEKDPRFDASSEEYQKKYSLNFKPRNGGTINAYGVYYPSCKEWQENIVANKNTDKEFEVKVMEKVEDENNPVKPGLPTLDATWQEDSNFKPIDTSGMKAKNPPSDESADVVTIYITGEGEGGDDTTSQGLSEIAAFERSNQSVSNLFGMLKKICNIVLGLAIVFGLASIVVLMVQLGVYSANPKMRAIIMHKLIVVGIATALSTSVSVFFNFFINILTRQ